ncbi:MULTISPECIES: acetyl-CoA carboxylase biotin carboxyl carrier protein [Streptomycetaceae]|uniref:Biotin carboxyl carrier protein of acetyl-CoA carboxylase n=1 Tax=Streptantibioticus cattleyicolor (strain ATCC 35852 / DSM 46488 / JCM 4925 / NBRC 14057 / NRRL 8057) TaxID=1003195 RepID=F8K0J1_STREN|nr:MULTISPECIES: acetyl-CoA carboxylase biotin carboxyl carrier protein [Streptomycetaceae]AEW97395.1 acetyl-CoA carboxylase, biotin carboxyl carrier protein [Streptantibioticus cattleyicolor NRRL 8057 = DSM 46488]MYS61841.1 acetyl-CoA carboxylase biotin carboxyl carrier protein [Streptomyces sp. SID5468]CCB77719.1 PdmP2 (modular protein) [Streptantibioticus cattleyicolor NRRL 8057 = DSM 46488]
MTTNHYAKEFEPLKTGQDAIPELTPGAAAERLAHTATRLAHALDAPLRRIRVQQGETSVELEWPEYGAPEAEAVTARAEAAATAPAHLTGAAAEATGPAGDPPGACVTAPMVGTFYHAPEPGAAPFVQVGDLVEKGQQIGIVEAMKLMNPIESDTRGRVTALLVEDGRPVEYDQPLVALEPVADDEADASDPAPGPSALSAREPV